MPQYDLNLRDYWQILQKRQGILLFIFFSVLTSTIVYTNLQKPVYRAVASVQWQVARPVGQKLIEMMIFVKPGNPLVSQGRIIKSQPVLEKVVIELGLAGKDATPEKINNFVGFLKGAVSTEIIPDTNIIRIYVTHRNPKMAAQIANKVTEAYIWRNLEDKMKEVRQIREFCEGQLSDLEIKLKSSEENLTNFKEKEVPLGIAIPLQNRLAELEAKKSEFLRRYTELHPEVKEIKEQISIVKEQLKQMPEKELEYSRLMRDVEVYNNLYRITREKLELVRMTEVEKVPDASLVDPANVPGSPISPNRPFNYLLGVVIGLLLGLAGTFMVEQLDTSIGTIEDVESYIGLPVLGIIPFSPLEGKGRFIFPLPPRRKDKLSELKNRLIIYLSAQSIVVEAYQMLDTNIRSSFKEKTYPKIIIISSTAAGEGKTIVCANLAITMAKRGMRILLIDADLRRPILYRLFGLKREPGLSDILSGTHKLKDALRGFTDLFLGLKQEDPHSLNTLGLNNLQFITPGHLPANPAGLFTSERMSTLMDELRKGFDIVLFDSPPILPVSDVSIFGPKADAAIIVYHVGKTPRSALQRAKKQLESVGAKVNGVVLNCLNPQAELSRSYYYYRHYRYYGKREDKGNV